MVDKTLMCQAVQDYSDDIVHHSFIKGDESVHNINTMVATSVVQLVEFELCKKLITRYRYQIF